MATALPERIRRPGIDNRGTFDAWAYRVARDQWQRQQQLVFDELTQIDAALQRGNVVLALEIERRGGVFALDIEEFAVDMEMLRQRLQAALAFERHVGVGFEAQRRAFAGTRQPCAFARGAPANGRRL